MAIQKDRPQITATKSTTWTDKLLPEIKPLFTAEYTPISNRAAAKGNFNHLQQELVPTSLHG